MHTNEAVQIHTYIYVVFYSMHLQVSVAPVSIFRLSLVEILGVQQKMHKMHDKMLQDFCHLFRWVSYYKSYYKIFLSLLFKYRKIW